MRTTSYSRQGRLQVELKISKGLPHICWSYRRDMPTYFCINLSFSGELRFLRLVDGLLRFNVTSLAGRGLSSRSCMWRLSFAPLIPGMEEHCRSIQTLQFRLCSTDSNVSGALDRWMCKKGHPWRLCEIEPNVMSSPVRTITWRIQLMTLGWLKETYLAARASNAGYNWAEKGVPVILVLP